MRWVLAACLGVSGLTLLLPSTPTYDPWAWILWGRQIVELDLVTDFGPSWKPLPMLFIVPFQGIGALLGDDSFAPYAWLWIARAGGLLACAMAFRLARRFVGGGALGALAGVVALAALFSSFKFVRDSALGNSEPLMAALVLWAFERHLDGRRDHALFLASGAALMRPEIWLFLGLYGIWLWFTDPRLRGRMVALAAGILALWFLPEWWGSGHPERALTRAQEPRPSSPAFADFPAGEILRRWKSTVIFPVAVAGLVGLGVAAVRFYRRLGPLDQRSGAREAEPSARRRDWATLVLAGGGLAWLALVAGMTQAGFAGNQRYLIIPTAALSVLAGIGVARLIQGVMLLVGRRFGARVARAAALVVVAGGLAASSSAIAFKLDNAETIRDALEYEASLWKGLKDVIDEAGGREPLVACGGLYSGAFQTQMLAYELHVHGRRVGILNFTPPGAIFRTRTALTTSPVP